MPITDPQLTAAEAGARTIMVKCDRIVRLVNMIRRGTADEVPLTAGQITAIRAAYDTLKSEMQTAFTGMP